MSDQKRIVQLEAELELCRQALREIGEKAVVTWHDTLVGLVDGALKNDQKQADYWSTAKQYKKRSEELTELIISAYRLFTIISSKTGPGQQYLFELLGEVLTKGKDKANASIISGS